MAKLPKDRFKMIKESEDRTIEKLKKLVREEEQAVKKLNRKVPFVVFLTWIRNII